MEYEELDRKVVRMLKGALTPHIHDFELEVAYDTEKEPEFDFVSDTENFTDSETDGKEKERDGDVSVEGTTGSSSQRSSQPILLYDENFQESNINVDAEKRAAETLPTIAPPRAIRAPYNIPPLYPFIRTNVFLLMNPHSSKRIPKWLKFTATSNDSPLELRIPVCDIGTGETIHHLASRKAVIELEEGHGWVSHAKDEKGNKFKHFHADTKQRLAERECQNLGIKFQVTGKYCSFVALEENSSSSSEQQDKQHTPREHVVERVSLRAQSARFSSIPAPLSFSGPGITRTGGVHGRRVGLRGGRTGGVEGDCAPNIQGSMMQVGLRDTSSNQVAPSTSMGPGDSNRLCRAAAPALAMCMVQAKVAAPGTMEPGVPRPLCGSTASPAAPRLGGMLHRTVPVVTTLVPTSTKTPQMRMHELIQLQTFEGSWMWSNELFELLECNMNSTINKLVTMYRSVNRQVEKGFPHGDEATVLATLLAMGWLRKKHTGSRAVWELVHGKASEWVRLQLKKMRDQRSPAAIIASIQDEIVDMI